MAQRKVSNPLALAVLACLSERPMHPYEISATLKHRHKEGSIRLNYGSLYSVVDALARHRLIAAIGTRQEGNRPARTTYEITATGTTELHDWLAELVSTPVKEFPALEAALSLLPVLPPDTVVDLLEQRIERLTVELTAGKAMARESDAMGLPELFRIEWDYYETLLRAELRFVRDLAGRIRAGTLGGIGIWRRLHELQAEGVSMADVTADPTAYLAPEDAAWFSQP